MPVRENQALLPLTDLDVLTQTATACPTLAMPSPTTPPAPRILTATASTTQATDALRAAPQAAP